MRSPWLSEYPKSTNPLAFFWFASKPHMRPMIAALGCVIVADILSALLPYMFKLIVDAVDALATGGTYQALLWTGVIYIAISSVREVIWRLSGYAGSYWATGVRATARETLSRYVTLHGREYFADRFAGSIANKIGHASNGARDMVDSVLWQFLELAVSIVVSVFIMWWVHPIFGLALIGWILVSIPINIYFAYKRIPYSVHSQELETESTGATVDLLSNAAAMQEYARRDFELARLRNLILRRREAGLRDWHFGEDSLMLNGFVQALFAAVMMYAAIYLAGAQLLTAGNVVLVITTIYRLEDKFLFLGSHVNAFSERWGEVAEGLREIFIPHDIADVPGARPLVVASGAITFDHVTFTYAGTDTAVLSDFQLAIPTHQKVGLVGKSGAGKSTLVKLLLRHYEVTRGAVTIDEQNIATATLDSLRQSVAVVPQEPLLFHRTLRENIAYGNLDATDEEIVEAARMAHAHEFISRLPQGYDTLVGERGVKLSGGERQRVAIARAILKNAPILILDEATASLDSESEALIQQALQKLMEGKTVIAIAHRLSTLREMDRIIVLDKGEIAEDGTHAQLLERGGIYASLWNHQAGGFIAED